MSNSSAGSKPLSTLPQSTNVPWSRRALTQVYARRNILLVLSDIAIVILAFFLAWYFRYELEWYRAVDPASYTNFSYYFGISLLASVLILAAYYIEGLYSLPRGTSYLDEFYRLLNGTTTVTIILMVGNFMFQPAYHSRLFYGLAGILVLVFASLTRLLYRWLLALLGRRGIGLHRVVLVGAGETSRMIMRALLANPIFGYQVVGFLDDDPERGQRNLGPFVGLGPIDNLDAILVEHHVDEVIVTLPWQYHRRIMRVFNQCERANVQIRVVPDILQMSLSQVDLKVLDGIPMLGIRPSSISGVRYALKRALDLAVSVIGLILISPILLIIAIAIKLDSRGPVLFKQPRVGKNGTLFTTYKFRSMVVEAEAIRDDLEAHNEADGPLFKIRNDPRMTRVGRYLRRLSLDELPQVFNVLRGDMSLVGPRPALPQEVDAYEPWHRKRLEVLPGITGLWQVSGRSDLSFDEMMLLDIYYVENWSPLLDLSILLRTIPRVLTGDGAY